MTSSFPSISFTNLPTVHVQPLGQGKVWDDVSYIPFVSNIKGAINIGLGIVIATVSVIAFPILLSLSAAFHIKDLLSGQSTVNFVHGISIGTALAAYALIPVAALVVVPTIIVRGVLESIPFAGNLTLGFLDGRIQIIPNQNC